MASRAAQTARRIDPAPGRPTPSPARRGSSPGRVSPERRRRARHYALRRRDLALDAVAGLLATILLISLTAGLGVLLLLVIPLAVALVVSSVLERRRARRATPVSARPRQPAGSKASAR